MAYARQYENSLHFSPHFQSYADSLVARLIERYDLHGKKIIEIGCGNGDFLRLLCEAGRNCGIGFDPSFVSDERSVAGAERVTIIKDYYSERYVEHKADFICSRHVLEHVDHPRNFLNSVRRAIGGRSDTAVYFEVPNVMHTLKKLGIWDLIYEHFSYFSASSLSRLFTSCGFVISDITEAYGGQFLGIEALPEQDVAGAGITTEFPEEDQLEAMARDVQAFSERYRSKVRSWRDELEQIEAVGQQAVIWGTGSKGVTFLNVLGARDQIKYAVDINPQKQGMYVPGTGQQIVPPEFLKSHEPDIVIVMNPVYKDEIHRTIECLGIGPEVACV
jgi:SAM-dependent methyltransferase